MWKITSAAAVSLAIVTSSALAAPPSPAPLTSEFIESRIISTSSGLEDGYFVICASVKSRAAAQRKANQIGGYVINTSHYDNLRNGYYSAVLGPYVLPYAKSQKPRGCYIKSGW